MNSQLARLLTVCATVFLLWQGTRWLQASFDVTVIPPAQDLAEFPRQLGQWAGSDAPMDADVAQFVGAHAQLSRAYTHADGTRVALYAAVWTDESIVDDIAPHHPTLCYANAGWTVADTRQRTLTTSAGNLPVSFSLMQRGENSVVTAHWYQLGDLHYTSSNAGRLEISRLWGQRQWPSLVKVLLQTPAASIEAAAPRLEELAGEIHAWTQSIK